MPQTGPLIARGPSISAKEPPVIATLDRLLGGEPKKRSASGTAPPAWPDRAPRYA